MDLESGKLGKIHGEVRSGQTKRIIPVFSGFGGLWVFGRRRECILLPSTSHDRSNMWPKERQLHGRMCT